MSKPTTTSDIARSARLRLLDAAAAARSLPLAGRAFHCPCCGWSFRRFTAGGFAVAAKVDGYCPRCNSKPRHRWLWLNLPDSLSRERASLASVLHIAPAHSTYRAFSALDPAHYLPVGLDPSRRNRLRMDVTRPALAARFDVVVCVHVLEHLDDDRAAMAALAALTKPDGVLLIGVPIRAGATLEDPAITNPVRRNELFGEPDHRRWYGRDIVDRLRESGIAVHASLLTDDAQPDLRIRCGLKPGEGLFVCGSVAP